MAGGREAMESATENIPPMAAQADQVRLKWRGKSSPRWWQHQWQGKPHPEQDQISRQWRGSRRLRVGRLSVR